MATDKDLIKKHGTPEPKEGGKMTDYSPAYFIMDIESKPQEDLVQLYQDEIQPSKVLKDPDKIKADIEKKNQALKKKMSLDQDAADIICMGIKRYEKDGSGKTEILKTPKEIEKFFNDYPFAILVTFNGKNFDIPLLIKYGIKHNLDLPYKDLREMTNKWKESRHIDLQEIICPGEYKSLDLLLQIYLGIKKKPIDFDTATEEEIIEHNIEDLENTEKIFRKFKKLI